MQFCCFIFSSIATTFAVLHQRSSHINLDEYVLNSSSALTARKLVRLNLLSAEEQPNLLRDPTIKYPKLLNRIIPPVN